MRHLARHIPFSAANPSPRARCKKWLVVTALLIWPAVSLAPSPAAGKRYRASDTREEITHSQTVELWHYPRDIRSRDLFYGAGGEGHAPHTTFTFTKEDMHGTNPKFQVRDENGVKWRVKLGVEGRPETAASRLLWAVGYSTNQFYFVPDIKVEGLPRHLHRGQNLIGAEGTIHNVELRRQVNTEKKIGMWSWHHNPFDGTREFNGLRVMMALLNNWDLKDDNNAVYKVARPGDLELDYRVSDLGASFGTTGRSWTARESKGNYHSYSHSRFIRKVTPDDVDFYVPTRPALINFFELPDFIRRLRLRWIGRDIPRADARWTGQLLVQLSPRQIRDAFRAAGYNGEESAAYAQVVEARIRQLNGL